MLLIIIGSLIIGLKFGAAAGWGILILTLGIAIEAKD